MTFAGRPQESQIIMRLFGYLSVIRGPTLDVVVTEQGVAVSHQIKRLKQRLTKNETLLMAMDSINKDIHERQKTVIYYGKG